MEKKIKIVELCIIIIFSSILISQFIVENICFKANVEGSSMEPLFSDGDKIFVLRHGEIQRGKIIIALDSTSRKYIIKRCIGLPGDRVKVEGDTLYINNKKVDEPYVKGVTNDFEEVKVGNNEYFVMGDNREKSKDSRVIGCIKKKDIYGVVIVREK